MDLYGDEMLVLVGRLSCGMNMSEKICSSHRSEESVKIRDGNTFDNG